MRPALLLLLLLTAPLTARAQHTPWPVTRAEASQYLETTRYDEVVAFVEELAQRSERVALSWFGYTTEGRRLPLVVVGGPADPSALRADGRLRVFVQANIHAGEVCGKEAMLMLLRDLAQGAHAAWADSIVLIVAPLYNADGNERVSLYNRPAQNGPLGGMGQRPNAQGYDLNRDHMKLDSPEARALVRLMNAYDPHVAVDLHTTNGSYHAYHLTYSPPLHPATPEALLHTLRADWLPAVTQAIRARYGWHFYYYGNVPPPRSGVERGWYTFDHRPRFNNNYVGLRGRFAILSEAYAYASFEERVLSTKAFVEEILAYAAARATALRRATEQADALPVAGTTIPVRAAFARSETPVEILMGAVEETVNPFSGAPLLVRQDVVQPEVMPEFGTFAPEETVVAPRAYLVPPSQTRVRDLVEAHGLRYEVLAEAAEHAAEAFLVDSVRVAERPFQGHNEQTLLGHYVAGRHTLPAGTWRVPTNQPLGRLLVLLLEPRSDDGVAAWNLLAPAPAPGGTYPILREPMRR